MGMKNTVNDQGPSGVEEDCWKPSVTRTVAIEQEEQEEQENKNRKEKKKKIMMEEKRKNMMMMMENKKMKMNKKISKSPQRSDCM
jgi:hypothetical protein